MGLILKEYKQNLKEINGLIDKQLFTIGDANKYLQRYTNLVRALEDLEESRDKWKKRALKAEEKLKT